MGKNIAIPDGVRRDILARYQNGESAQSIATGLKISKGSVYGLLRKTGTKTARVMHKLSEGQETEILKRYGQGESVQSISKDFLVNAQTIHNMLERRGVVDTARKRPRIRSDQRREIVAAVKAGDSVPVVAKTLGVSESTVTVSLRRARAAGDDIVLPQGRPKIYEVNDHAFDELTPEALYWLGFIFADGCVHESRLIVCLASVDVGHLQKLRRFLGATYPIRETASHSSFNRESTFVWFSPRSTRITDVLCAHGVVTKRTRVPAPELARSRDFWRGAVDGDGWLGASDRGLYMGLSGQALLLEAFQGFLRANNLSHQNYTLTTSGIFRLQFNDAQAEDAIRALYSDACVALDRKNVRAQAIIRGEYDKSVSYKELAARQRVTDDAVAELLREDE